MHLHLCYHAGFINMHFYVSRCHNSQDNLYLQVLNFGPVTPDGQTESDAYEPTVHKHWCAQKGIHWSTSNVGQYWSWGPMPPGLVIRIQQGGYLLSRLPNPQKEACQGSLIQHQISQTFNAESECWDHPFLENRCCGEVPWSDLGAAIDIPCYFKANLKGLILSQNNMGCLWEPLNGTMEFHHNINFPKRDGPSIHILHWKSVIFDVVLNFLNKPLFEGWPTDYNANWVETWG